MLHEQSATASKENGRLPGADRRQQAGGRGAKDVQFHDRTTAGRLFQASSRDDLWGQREKDSSLWTLTSCSIWRPKLMPPTIFAKPSYAKDIDCGWRQLPPRSCSISICTAPHGKGSWQQRR